MQKTVIIDCPLDICEDCRAFDLQIAYHDLIGDDRTLMREYRAYCSHEAICQYVHGRTQKDE